MTLKELYEKYGELGVPECFAKYYEYFDKLAPAKTIWNLQDGDECWASNGEEAYDFNWQNWASEIESRKLGFIHLTQEEAEAEVERRKVETLLIKYGGRREYIPDDHNYILTQREYDSNDIKISEIDGRALAGTIYFSDTTDVWNALLLIGIDRVANAMFRKKQKGV